MKQASPARKKALLVKALVAVVGSAGSVCVLLMAPIWGVCIFLSVVAALAAYEFTTATRFVTHRYLVVLSVLHAVGVIWAAAYHLAPVWWGMWLFAAFALAFTPAVFTEKAADAQEGAAAVFAAFVPSGITALFLYLMQLENGRLLLLAPLVAAWAADSLALLGGMAFGKHKLCPRVSPNKTVEGFFCGILGGALGMLIYALILRACGHGVSLPLFIGVGAVGALFGALGDLTFSAVKRSVGIKDFGTFMPEHGGVLDRFDSMSVVAPLVEALMLLIPFALRAV